MRAIGLVLLVLAAAWSVGSTLSSTEKKLVGQYKLTDPTVKTRLVVSADSTFSEVETNKSVSAHGTWDYIGQPLDWGPFNGVSGRLNLKGLFRMTFVDQVSSRNTVTTWGWDGKRLLNAVDGQPNWVKITKSKKKKAATVTTVVVAQPTVKVVKTKVGKHKVHVVKHKKHVKRHKAPKRHRR